MGGLERRLLIFADFFGTAGIPAARPIQRWLFRGYCSNIRAFTAYHQLGEPSLQNLLVLFCLDTCQYEKRDSGVAVVESGIFVRLHKRKHVATAATRDKRAVSKRPSRCTLAVTFLFRSLITTPRQAPKKKIPASEFMYPHCVPPLNLISKSEYFSCPVTALRDT